MNEKTSNPALSPRLEDALDFAARLQRLRRRDGIGSSRAHFQALITLVIEHGGSEDEAIAALQQHAGGGREALEDIRRRFGDPVADLIAESSDTFETSKLPWREGKQREIDAVAGQSLAARLISAADRLQRATAALEEYQRRGESIWWRFEGEREGALWYFTSYAISLCANGQSVLGSELLRVVSALKRPAGQSPPEIPKSARDFSSLSHKRTYHCPCGHTWARKSEHEWWDTERGPSDAEIAASIRVSDDCPQCRKPVPPTACPECGGAVKVETGNLHQSALDDYAYEEEDFLVRCADGHGFLFAHRSDSKK